MLDTSARRGDRAVASLLCLGNALDRMAAPLNVCAPTGLLQPGRPFNAGVATVGVNVLAGVARIEQFLEDNGMGDGSTREGILRISLQRLSTFTCSL